MSIGTNITPEELEERIARAALQGYFGTGKDGFRNMSERNNKAAIRSVHQELKNIFDKDR